MRKQRYSHALPTAFALCNAVTDMMKEDPDAVRELLKLRAQKLN
jgi:hypothetical protein